MMTVGRESDRWEEIMQKKIERFIHKTVHILEFIIAVLTMVVLLGLLVYEVYRMVTTPGYFEDANIYLHNILTIVVGLEFVRMLINMTQLIKN